MKKYLIILFLFCTKVYSQNIVITSEQLKTANLIFAEHQMLSETLPLLENKDSISIANDSKQKYKTMTPLINIPRLTLPIDKDEENELENEEEEDKESEIMSGNESEEEFHKLGFVSLVELYYLYKRDFDLYCERIELI